MNDDNASPGEKVGAKYKNGPSHLKRIKTWWAKLDKRQKIILVVVAVLVLAIVAMGAVLVLRKKPAPKKTPTPVASVPAPVKPKTVASRLSGVQIEPSLNLRPVTGVMIENSPDARPQSGLPQAGVVFEAVAEGGITRFLALFLDGIPDNIGPVRSSRPYYLDWILPFDGAYAHAGGSPEALSQIKQLGVKDLDQFANAGAYHRVAQRYAPHNLYTSTGDLDNLEHAKGYTTSTFTSFPRKDPAPLKPGTAGAVNSIDLAMSSYLYNPHYDYDIASNSYKRGEGGKPHIDEKTGQQLSPTVVIALVMPSALEADGTHSAYATVGNGAMYVFQDGFLTKGVWSKSSSQAQFVFSDDKGQPLKLNPGQTWITMVNNDAAVAYK